MVEKLIVLFFLRRELGLLLSQILGVFVLRFYLDVINVLEKNMDGVKIEFFVF